MQKQYSNKEYYCEPCAAAKIAEPGTPVGKVDWMSLEGLLSIPCGTRESFSGPHLVESKLNGNCGFKSTRIRVASAVVVLNLE